MALATPLNWTIEASATDVTLDGVWRFAWSKATGATLAEVRVQVALTADTTFVACLYDSGYCAPDGHQFADGWHEVWPQDMRAADLSEVAASTVYRWRVLLRDTVAGTATSTATTFTTEAAKLSQANWLASQ